MIKNLNYYKILTASRCMASEAPNCKALLILTQIPSALICIYGKRNSQKFWERR